MLSMQAPAHSRVRRRKPRIARELLFLRGPLIELGDQPVLVGHHLRLVMIEKLGLVPHNIDDILCVLVKKVLLVVFVYYNLITGQEKDST